MRSSILSGLMGLILLAVVPSAATGQQPRQVPPARGNVAPQPPFKLNPIEEGFLDIVLAKWEEESNKILTFRCPFDRWEYHPTFSPRPDVPFHKDRGELGFGKPDKGSFQITQVRRWKTAPQQPGQQPSAQLQGNWVEPPNVVGDHWVCDGKNVYEYRHDQETLVVRPIPAELQGQAIVDGPLPFLFGAKAAKLKQRYWLKVTQQPNPNEIWLLALPKFQADAANFQKVELILRRQDLLPQAMNVQMPDGSRHVYMFDLANAKINGHMDRLKSLFAAPRTPFGWKRVVEQSPPVRQAQKDNAG